MKKLIAKILLFAGLIDTSRARAEENHNQIPTRFISDPADAENPNFRSIPLYKTAAYVRDLERQIDLALKSLPKTGNSKDEVIDLKMQLDEATKKDPARYAKYFYTAAATLTSLGILGHVKLVKLHKAGSIASQEAKIIFGLNSTATTAAVIWTSLGAEDYSIGISQRQLENLKIKVHSLKLKLEREEALIAKSKNSLRDL